VNPTDPGEAHTRFFEGYPAHDWDGIEQRYLGDAANDWPHLLPMAELARRVRISGIGRSLGGIVSMHQLRCMMHKKFPPLEPSLSIEPHRDSTFTLSYDRSAPSHRTDWTKVYPQTELMPAFSRFLIRVGWVPRGHPAHEILIGGGA
jgi:hypothetical protein